LIRVARLFSVFILRSFENAGLDLIIPGFPKIPRLYMKIDIAFKDFMAIWERVSACCLTVLLGVGHNATLT